MYGWLPFFGEQKFICVLYCINILMIIGLTNQNARLATELDARRST